MTRIKSRAIDFFGKQRHWEPSLDNEQNADERRAHVRHWVYQSEQTRPVLFITKLCFFKNNGNKTFFSEKMHPMYLLQYDEIQIE